MSDIFVVGGGLAGLRAAKKLKATLISKDEYFVFKPRLPELINNPDISRVAKPLIRCHDKVIIGCVDDIDTKKQLLYVNDNSYHYDFLVLATGASPLMPVKGVEKYAQTVSTTKDVINVRKALPVNNILVIGGGPTGIETACELSLHGNVTLMDRGECLCKQFSKKTQDYANKVLAKLGVNIALNNDIVRVEDGFVVSNSQKTPFDMLVWTSGVKANVFSSLPSDKGILVNDYLQVRGFSNIFAVGDCAQTKAPLTAQAAQQEADTVVHNIRSLLSNSKKLRRASYNEKGKFLLLGEKNAYMESFINIKGLKAYYLRNAYYSMIFSQYYT